MNRDHNIGSFLAPVDSGVIFNSIAGSTNDNSEKAGVIIDRGAHEVPLSMSLLMPFKAVLGAAATLKLGYRIEHGNDSALADTADFASVAVAGNVVATANASGQTLSGIAKADIDLGGAKRYLRINLTTDLSAANTDTSVQAAVAVFGGESVIPAV
jgi:hypothetical protein